MPLYGDVGRIVRQAATELGLAAEADPVASTNQTQVQLCQCLAALGRSLVKEHEWQVLTQVGSFLASTSGVALPADFDRFVDSTAWKRSTITEAEPIGASDWEALTALNSVGTTPIRYRLRGNKIYAMPGDGSTVYFEYISIYWLSADAAGPPDNYDVDSSASTVWFEERLMVAGVKWRWRRDRGMPCDAEQEDYLAMLALCKAADKPTGAIQVTTPPVPPPITGAPPDTGWGL